MIGKTLGHHQMTDQKKVEGDADRDARRYPFDTNRSGSYFIKNFQCFVLLVAALILLISIKSVSQTSTGQGGQSDRFVMTAAQKLGIDILIIDRISLKGTYPVYDKDSSVSKQDLLDLLVGFLRDKGAVLVKSGIVCQIVPLSRVLGDRWSPITGLADIPSITRSASIRMIMMYYANASLADFCANITKLHNIPSIVIDPAVKGSVTLLASGIPKDALSPILMTLLDNNEAVLVESMGEYQIVPKSKELPKQWKVLTNLTPSALPTKP